MIYLDMALAHLLAEDRFPPDTLWHQPLVSCNVSMRVGSETRTATTRAPWSTGSP
jgi:hypothetical protein